MIILNYRDASPIYEQIKNCYMNMILSGALKEGDKLPSVRELAVELAINPNTIQRAYRELERDGCIYSVAGKGSFVSGGGDMRAKRIEECRVSLTQTVRELLSLGATKQEILDMIEGGESTL